MAYTRVNWEDLPSTNTPINATNLNKMDKGIKDLEDSLATVATTGDYDDLSNKPTIPTNDHLVNVSNELDLDYKVNVLYSKNLLAFDIRQDQYMTYEIISPSEVKATYSSSGSSIQPATTYYTGKIPAGTYTMKNYTESKRLFIQIGSTSDYDHYTDASDNGYTFTYDGTSLLRFVFANQTAGQVITYKAQLEKGSIATSYEPYVVPSIYVDNEMLVSKNIYSTGEVVIGEWLGKPLYRKVYKMTNQSNSYSVLKPDYLSEIAKLDIMQLDGDGAYIGAYYWTSSDYLRVFYINNNIQIRTSKTANTFTHWITIEYTKTTD